MSSNPKQSEQVVRDDEENISAQNVISSEFLASASTPTSFDDTIYVTKTSSDVGTTAHLCPTLSENIAISAPKLPLSRVAPVVGGNSRLGILASFSPSTIGKTARDSIASPSSESFFLEDSFLNKSALETSFYLNCSTMRVNSTVSSPFSNYSPREGADNPLTSGQLHQGFVSTFNLADIPEKNPQSKDSDAREDRSLLAILKGADTEEYPTEEFFSEYDCRKKPVGKHVIDSTHQLALASAPKIDQPTAVQMHCVGHADPPVISISTTIQINTLMDTTVTIPVVVKYSPEEPGSIQLKNMEQ